MDVVQPVDSGGGEVRSGQVRLRPNFKRRLLIIAGGMVAVCLATGVGVVFSTSGGVSADLSDPEAPMIFVLGSLEPFQGDDLEEARQVMTGDKITDMTDRLRTIRHQLSSIKLNMADVTEWQMISADHQVQQSGDHATVVEDVYDDIAFGADGLSYRTDAVAWTFQTVHVSFPHAGWYMSDFTAPDICKAYFPCTAQPPAPTPTGPAYPPVHLSCAAVNAAGVADRVVSYTINLDAAGVPDFSAAWQTNNQSCTTDVLYAKPVASSPVELAAVKASSTSGGGSTPVGVLYADCAQRFHPDNVLDQNGRLGERLGEYRGVLVLCPHHPDAQAIEAAINAG
jgi:hypothetical protein